MSRHGRRALALSDTAIAASICVLTVIVYLPALWIGFTADDFFILARLKQFDGLRHPLSYFGSLGFFEYYRPLTFLSHAFDWHIWHGRPAGFHLTNVCLHAANAVLVFVLGRRLGGRTLAIVASLLFALHPASHEAVYWISARFDLLATGLSLLAMVFLCGSARQYPFGVLAFGLALLAKESALALPVIFLAHEVIVRRVEWRSALGRLTPLIIVALVYGVLRSQGGAVEAVGGAARIPKLLMLAAMTGGLLWLAHARPSWLDGARVEQRDRHTGTLVIVTAGAAMLTLLFLSPASGWLREKIGFASFSLFYLASPVAVPAPPAWLFDRPKLLDAATEVVVLLAVVWGIWRSRRWIVDHLEAAYLLVFIAAALAPVSSMTSGPRYLYLASAGVSLLGGAVFHWLPSSFQRPAIATLAFLLSLSVVQLITAGQSWKWASDMTRDALASMSATLAPCGTQDVVVLTAPVGIRGVYSNLNEVAFEVAGCQPASFTTVLRVMQRDAHVEVARRDQVVELRVPNYAGNFVASRDLRHFDVPIGEQETLSLDLPIGKLETAPDNGAQLFRLTISDRVQQAHVFYYSDGQLRMLKTP